MPRITLLTDFGTRDDFIGAVKGAIQEVFPGAARGASAARTLGVGVGSRVRVLRPSGAD